MTTRGGCASLVRSSSRRAELTGPRHSTADTITLTGDVGRGFVVQWLEQHPRRHSQPHSAARLLRELMEQLTQRGTINIVVIEGEYAGTVHHARFREALSELYQLLDL